MWIPIPPAPRAPETPGPNLFRQGCCIPSVAILRRDAALGESQDEMHREPTRLPFGLVRSRYHELLTC